MPAADTRMNAAICARSAPSRLAWAMLISAISAISPVTVQNTMAATGVCTRSLTRASHCGPLRSSPQASMYREACSSESGVPISAQITNPMPSSASRTVLWVISATRKLTPGARPPGMPSLVGSLAAR